MRTLDIPGGMYSDALPSGEYVCLILDSHLETHFGVIPFVGSGQQVLFPRCTITGGPFRFAGQNTGPQNTLEWAGEWIIHSQTPCGVSPVIYDHYGSLHISNCSVGSQGYRCLAPGTQEILSGDQTYSSPFGLSEYTPIGDGIYVGQGSANGGIVIWDGTHHRELASGDRRVIRVNRVGNDIAICCWNHGPSTSASFWWLTLDELLACKIIDATPIPAPEPEPIYNVARKAFPRKMWISSFFSYSQRYGDTVDFLGNAITLVEDPNGPNVLIEDIKRVSPLGRALIVQGDNVGAETNINQTVSWWTSGKDIDSLGIAVGKCKERPQKPIIAYLDKGFDNPWPTAKPNWLTSIVWPSIQAYRNPDEALSVFTARLNDMLAVVSNYKQPIFLTVRMDDFNGYGSEQQTLDAIGPILEMAQNWRVIGLHLFSDRRGNGMAKFPSLRNQAKNMQSMNPGERPNRFDYWTPNGDLTASITNKLKQTTELIQLGPVEKDFILSKL